MELSKQNIKYYILPVLIILVAITLFALNIYLGKRLERYLRKELVERVSKATDGFYSLSYSNLSINLLNGELRIEGIEIKPDTTIFAKWMRKDSLPENYLNAQIKVIDFKGLNLIWKTNYKKLHFEKFEIEAPVIQIFNSTFSDRLEKRTKNTTIQTLYQLIEPYINVLSVRTLNLKSATVSYNLNNNPIPTIYCLDNVSFNAFGFWLDSNSSTSGKLLYCDDFDFTTNQSQTLLTNNDFSLYTEHIHLSTKDSIISIKNIRLLPQEEIWEINKLKPSTYINGEIKRVGVNGIKFRRDNGLNFLSAGSFDIDSSEIKIFNISEHHSNRTVYKHNIAKDTIVNSLSVYEIISPILRSVSIDHIGIDNTNIHLSYTHKDSLETFSLENFKFNAYNFLVDSTVESNNVLSYAKNFNLEANHIKGILTARNHLVGIDYLAFNSFDRTFRVNNISLNPISTWISKDYIKGYIDSIVIEKLDYNKGLSANVLQIESPQLNYYKKKESQKSNQKKSIHINDLLSPILQYLSIEKIYLNNGKFLYNDLAKTNPINYELKNFNFFATNFMIDESTGKHKSIFFKFDHFGFSFSDFINYLSKDDYKLSINNGVFSTINEELKLENVKFTSQEHKQREQSNHQIDFMASLIHLNGFQNSIFDLTDSIRIKSIFVDSPNIKMLVTKNKHQKRKDENSPENNKNTFLNKLVIENLSLKNSKMRFEDETENKWFENNLGLLTLLNLFFDQNNRVFQFDELQTNELKTQSISKNGNASLELTEVILQGFNLNLQPNNSDLEIGAFKITNPELYLQLSENPLKKEESSDIKATHNIYHSLKEYVGQIGVDSFSLINGNIVIDYPNKAGLFSKQKLNSLHLRVDNLKLDNSNETFHFEDLRFKSTDLNIPIDNAFYNLHIDSIDLNNQRLTLSDLEFVSPYSKMDFAYQHPRHDDWFDVKVSRIRFTDIDIPYYLKNQIFKAKNLAIHDATLLNFKNRKIDVPLRLIPMIYEGIQKAPVKMDIEQVAVNNVDVTYEELAIKGNKPGKFFLTEMNGIFSGFTNIPTSMNQFIRLDANGKLMGEGYFTATWMLPVDTLNDQFLLNIELNNFDLTHLNDIITPLAPASIKSGYLDYLRVDMDATSIKSDINMLFLYKDLKVDIFHNNLSNDSPNKLYTNLANLVLFNNNPTYPNRKKAKPREVKTTVIRDPYHSTFNYLWQILRPAATESVGISKKKQSLAKKIASAIQKRKEKRAHKHAKNVSD